MSSTGGGAAKDSGHGGSSIGEGGGRVLHGGVGDWGKHAADIQKKTAETREQHRKIALAKRAKDIKETICYKV